MFKAARIHPHAVIPSRACEGDAGYDLTSVDTVEIDPGMRKLVATGIIIQIPNDCYARIAPRSGLSVKGIDVGAGVVDSSYRGEVKVLLINNSTSPYVVQPGDRVAQMVFERIYTPDAIIETSTTEINDTARGTDGFGSTGV